MLSLSKDNLTREVGIREAVIVHFTVSLILFLILKL